MAYGKEDNSALTKVWDNNLIEFSKFIKDKSICVVGNSVELMNYPDKGHGEFIDSHDFVIRFGMGAPLQRVGFKGNGIPPIEHQHKCIGKKTDGWCFGFFRFEMLESYKKAPHESGMDDNTWIFFNAVHSKIMDPIKHDLFPWERSFDVGIRRFKHNKNRAIYMHSHPELRNVIKEFNFQKGYLDTWYSGHGGPRISTGMWLFHFLLEKAKVDKFTMIGFDFFKKSTPTKRKNGPRGKYSNLDPASWYLPIGTNKFISKTQGIEVHDNPKEYDWVVDKITKNKIEWKILSDLSYDKIKIFDQWFDEKMYDV